MTETVPFEFELDPYMRHLGFQAEVPAPGRARVWGELRPEHLNSFGSAHGGFLFSLADSAFALASNSHGALAVALSAHIEYFKGTRAGDRLEAVATEISLTRRTGVYQIEIRNGAEAVALFTGTVYRRPEQPTTLKAGNSAV
ncbi:hydroxyphenylacetyl-CoA thioesterase PaaI [Parasulfuritortus cantonensis]|uniref:Hydroxyphenylacetyl-CoA thioesterase PaaI n=1 Tax=Parasulfuritortus cantonensis TaxID=2528202 RepID=A0A4R1BNR0_9PROT|nr:hydroxyphenylacetyl-CoA thioesterase PaaI [Parasulfuritortus cantonensis]TCJ18936.1 hydroxyphenylacetyl-CoA thioesterase PaaI [Parasulfuritortus cantonensis]